MQLSESLVFQMLQSEKEFPIDFDGAWQWVGYSRKEPALRRLCSNFDIGSDYIIVSPASSNGEAGRELEKNSSNNRIIVFLTLDCFKSFCMMAGTSKGKEVRRYFLDCERKLKEVLAEKFQKNQENLKKQLISAMVDQNPVSCYPKFDDEFYQLIYNKRGNGWEHRLTSNRPPCVGIWTNQIVYDRLLGGLEPGGIKDTLNSVNPKINGYRKRRHHWHFKELGEFHLNTHIEAVKALARVSPDGDWDTFMYNIQKGLPNGEPLQLTLWSIYNQMESSDSVH